MNSSDPASVAIQRLDKLNPRAADGQRRIVINAIGFPTTIGTSSRWATPACVSPI